MANEGSYSSSSSSPLVSGGQREEVPALVLPIGFRFDPTPEELVLHYVGNKNRGHKLPFEIPEVDLYKHHPKNLSGLIGSSSLNKGNFKYVVGNEMYFFTQLKPKTTRGIRATRSIAEGHWKDTSTASGKVIMDGKSGNEIGYKKTFTFYETKEIKTNWIMYEFGSTDMKNMNGYVLCRIYESARSSGNLRVATPMAIEDKKEASPIPHSFINHQTTTFPAHLYQTNLPNICESPTTSVPHTNQTNSMNSGHMFDSEQLRFLQGEFKDKSNFIEAIDIENDCTPMAIEEEVRTGPVPHSFTQHSKYPDIELEGMNHIQHSSLPNMHESPTPSVPHPNQMNSMDNSSYSWWSELVVSTPPSNSLATFNLEQMFEFPEEFVDGPDFVDIISSNREIV